MSAKKIEMPAGDPLLSEVSSSALQHELLTRAILRGVDQINALEFALHRAKEKQWNRLKELRRQREQFAQLKPINS